AMEKDGRKGFPLDVEMVGANVDKEGVYRLTDGQLVRLRVTAGRDCYLGVWSVLADGEIVQLSPEPGESLLSLRKDAPRIVPEITNLRGETSTGLDRVLVLASTRAWDLVQGDRSGQFEMFRTKSEQNRLQESLRGIRGLKLDVQVS